MLYSLRHPPRIAPVIWNSRTRSARPSSVATTARTWATTTATASPSASSRLGLTRSACFRSAADRATTRSRARGPAFYLRRGALWSDTANEGQPMDIAEIEVGALYKCDHDGAQYFGRVKEIKDGRCLVFGKKITKTATVVMRSMRRRHARLAQAREYSPDGARAINSIAAIRPFLAQRRVKNILRQTLIRRGAVRLHRN